MSKFARVIVASLSPDQHLQDFSLARSMNLLMAADAEGNQVLTGVVAQLTAEAKVVNLEMLRGATILAPPAIALEYLRAKSTISGRFEPQSGSPHWKGFHYRLSICWRNSLLCSSGSSE